MAHCDDIAPLLSAFNDGELSPYESNQVTEHLDGCGTCKATVLDYLLLGHHLRTAVALPSLDGFTEQVMKGIAVKPRPFGGRLLNRIEDLRERWVAAVSLMGTAVAVAALALVLTEPHTLQRMAGAHPAPRSAVNTAEEAPSTSAESSSAESTSAEPPFVPEHPAGETYISRLEAKPSSVATWSEPDTKTTVIWLGDDQP